MAKISNHYENYPKIEGGHTSEAHKPKLYRDDSIVDFIAYKIITALSHLLSSISGQSALKIKQKWSVKHTPIFVVINILQPKIDEADERFHIAFAKKLHNTGNYQQAMEVMRNLCERYPNSIAVWRLRAELAMLHCDTNEMKKTLYGEKEDDRSDEGLNSIDADSAFTLALKARLYLNNFKFFDATLLAQRALDECENHYYALIVMGMLHQLTGDEEEAASKFLRAVNHSQTINNEGEQNLENYVKIAYACRQWCCSYALKGITANLSIDKKIEKMISYTLFTPFYYRYDLLLCGNVIKKSNPERASEFLTKVLFQSKTSEAKNYQAIQSIVYKKTLSNGILKGSDEFRKLSKYLKYLVKGKNYINSEKLQKARNSYKKASDLHIDPNPYLQLKLAILSYRLEDDSSAKEYIEKVLEIAPNNLEAIVLGAIIYERLEQIDVSAKLWSRSYKQCCDEEMGGSVGNQLEHYIFYKFQLMDIIDQLSKLEEFYSKKLGREFPEKLFQKAIDQIESASEFHHDHMFELPRISFKQYHDIATGIFREDLEQVIKFMKIRKQPNIKGKDKFLEDLQLILSAEEVQRDKFEEKE